MFAGYALTQRGLNELYEAGIVSSIHLHAYLIELNYGSLTAVHAWNSDTLTVVV